MINLYQLYQILFRDLKTKGSYTVKEIMYDRKEKNNRGGNIYLRKDQHGENENLKLSGCR